MKKSIAEFLYRKYNCSFSQGGEDAMLASLFCQKNNGFFLDVGAFHPYKLSNTFLFYRKGWNGINIDAAPGSMEPFNKLRPKDINLECAINEKKQELIYYYLGEGNSMNSFSREHLEKMGKLPAVKREIKINTQRLDEILEKWTGGKEINFMSVDVEGMELAVLSSNNWTKFKPHVILLESFELINDENNYDLELKHYLVDKGYRVIFKTTTCIAFIRNDLKLNAYNHIIF